MSFLSNAARLLLGAPGDQPATPIVPLQARSLLSEYPSYEDQLAVIQNRSRYIWRSASADEALGVPSIFAAVSLISNTVGSLSMEAFRRGVLLSQTSTPRIVQRPNPLSTPRVFFRDTAYHLATRGEAWWWIAKRDPIDNSAMSLYPVPPWEIVIEENDRDRLRPTIRWADRVIPNDDIRQITYLPGRDGRGIGPLQKNGAAVSIAVEAQEWAANFFSGSVPSMIGTTEQDMTEAELRLMDEQWLEKPPNLPRWLTNGLKFDEPPFNPEKAQLNQARLENVGDHARMFNMPGKLLEYATAGSSLTYQNQEDIWADFQRRCLSPHYLEPIEQEISDLLTRSTVARFNLKQLLRASAKTRMEIHKTAIDAGIYGPEVAAQDEGYAPGSVDYAPVPFAPPQAVPTLLPPDRVLGRSALDDLHCPKCRKLLGRVAGAAEIMCPRCRTIAGVEARVAMPEAPAQPAINVTVHPPGVTFARGALQVDAPDLSPLTDFASAMAEIAAKPPPPVNVNVPATEVHIPAPEVTIAEGAVQVEVHPSPVTVEPATVTVNVPKPRPSRKVIERDGAGNIATITEEPA